MPKENETTPIIPFERAPFTNNFMFCEVMRDANISKPFLEELLNVKIADIVVCNKEDDLTDTSDAHGVRLDVFIEDAEHTRYNIEMQTGKQKALERRIRYYQSAIDRRFLQKGVDYDELPTSYIIFICDYDQYGRGLARYERKSIIEDAPDITYDDGTRTIILNTHYKVKNVADEIGILLDYAREKSYNASKEKSKLVTMIEQKMGDIRNDPIKEVKYMTYEMNLRSERRIGFDEGLTEGITRGSTNTQFDDIVSMMETLNLSFDQAIQALRVPAERVENYRARIALEQRA